MNGMNEIIKLHLNVCVLDGLFKWVLVLVMILIRMIVLVIDLKANAAWHFFGLPQKF